MKKINKKSITFEEYCKNMNDIISKNNSVADSLIEMVQVSSEFNVIGLTESKINKNGKKSDKYK